MLASPDEFRSAASALRAARHGVESDESSLRTAGSIFDSWRGPAADDARSTLYPICLNSIDMVKRDLNELAAMLDRSAGELQERLNSIYSIEQLARGWFARQPLPADGSQPRWIAEWWRYRPGRFPARGDSEWLQVRPYLRVRGVYC